MRNIIWLNNNITRAGIFPFDEIAKSFYISLSALNLNEVDFINGNNNIYLIYMNRCSMVY